jgi:hypothetical protein
MSEPINFGSQIDALEQPYPGYLDNFKEYYVLTKQFPNDDSYTRGYECSTANMQKAASDLFVISNNIQSEIEKMKQNTITLNMGIKEEKGRITELQRRYENATGEVGGAQTMISDSKKVYVIQYISNVSIFLGIILAGIIISKTFRPSVSS